MTPVMQTVFGYPDGNCFAACVASILDMPLDEMPSIAGVSFHTTWVRWLRARGLGMVYIYAGTGQVIAGMCIAFGDSPRVAHKANGERVTHAVVYEDMIPVHDPHPDQAFLDGKPKGWTVIYRLNPSMAAGK